MYSITCNYGYFSSMSFEFFLKININLLFFNVVKNNFSSLLKPLKHIFSLSLKDRIFPENLFQKVA